MSDQSKHSIIINHLRARFPSVEAIYLFGSQASGEAREFSDFDIAYLLPPQIEVISSWEQFILAQDLAAKLNADVDLIDLRRANTVFQFEIIGTAERIYTLDENTCVSFEALVLSMYQRFQIERRGILESIEESGKILSS